MNIFRSVFASAIGISMSNVGFLAQARIGEESHISEAVLLFVGGDKTILAYRSVPSLDGKGKIVALLARKQTKAPISSEVNYDYESEYSCELIVMSEDSMGARIAGRTSKVVDCNINDEHRRAKFRELDDAIELTPSKLTYAVTGNTTPSGWWSYSFELQDDKWHVSSAKNVSSFDVSDDGYIIVRTQEAFYPQDFDFIPMEELDTRRMADVLSRHVTNED